MDVVDYLAFALLALFVFTVPGWLWLRRAGLDPLVAVYAGPGAVALYAAAVVAFGVVLPWDVRTTCEIGAGVGAVMTLGCAVTAPSPLLPVRADLAGMAIFAAAFLSLAAFSGVPSAPFGGWNSATVGPGRVDTPRWPGLPSDNTLPYRTGQVALYKQGGTDIRDGFSVGWWLSDRTPLTGLDFAFMAGAFGVHVSDRNVEEQPVTAVPMTTLDHAGFWAYQVTAMLLNLAIILGVFLLARVWLSARVVILLLADPQLRTRWRRTTARFVAPAAVLVAPWSIFTSQVMHAVSRWTTAPLGTLMIDPADFHKSLSVAWHTFRVDGPLFAIWSRVQSTAASLSRSISTRRRASPPISAAMTLRSCIRGWPRTASPSGGWRASCSRPSWCSPSSDTGRSSATSRWPWSSRRSCWPSWPTARRTRSPTRACSRSSGWWPSSPPTGSCEPAGGGGGGFSWRWPSSC